MIFIINSTRLLYGYDIPITQGLTLYQAKIDEIINFSEDIYLKMGYLLGSIPSSMKSILWDMGYDYTKISDWEYFQIVIKKVQEESTRLLFREHINFAAMKSVYVPELENNVLYDEKTQLIITEKDYHVFAEYLRKMFCYKIKREKPANKFTKKILIDEDRRKRMKPVSDESMMIESMTITLVNTEEFPYTYETSRNITFHQLSMSYLQIQNKKQSCALLQGSFSGFVDTSKIPSSAMEWVYNQKKFTNM